mmetsp:Transcript_46358/g.110386  ORF Transcript_46358/g.110386 Transcript_46358/m.110386 type:complete len:208 (-) Transcript_46358:1153-1776(-)
MQRPGYGFASTSCCTCCCPPPAASGGELLPSRVSSAPPVRRQLVVVQTPQPRRAGRPWLVPRSLAGAWSLLAASAASLPPPPQAVAVSRLPPLVGDACDQPCAMRTLVPLVASAAVPHREDAKPAHPPCAFSQSPSSPAASPPRSPSMCDTAMTTPPHAACAAVRLAQPPLQHRTSLCAMPLSHPHAGRSLQRLWPRTRRLPAGASV